MIFKIVIPILSALALGFGVATTVILNPEQQLTEAPNPPAVSTLEGRQIAGLGEIQPLGEEVCIATPIAGVVSRVHVASGDHVTKGDALFEIDDRALQSQLEAQIQAHATAKAELDRMQALPRPEDIPPAQARVDAARASLTHAEDTLQRVEQAFEQDAASRSEFVGHRSEANQARARLAEAMAQLDRLRAGAWDADIQITETGVAFALAEVNRIRTEIDRLVIRAPNDGVVSRVNIRAGEWADSVPRSGSLMVIVPDGGLIVRVQVDEQDARTVTKNASAEAYLRDRSRTRLDLKFLHIEPRVVPKTSLTGSTTERVDTRVLYVVYRILNQPPRLYSGQKVDVFIAAIE